MVAEREASGPQCLCRQLEQAHALREPPGLHRDPCAGLGDVGGQHRADLGGPGHRLSEPAQRLTVPALLGFDQRQVVHRLHLAPRAGRRPGQQALVDRRGVGQPPDVLQQDGPLEIQLRGPRTADQRGGGVQVALRHRHPAKLLADGGVTHQQFRQRLVEMVPTRDPAGFVEQPDGRTVIQPGAVCPRQGPQRQGEGLGLAGPPGLGDQ